MVEARPQKYKNVQGKLSMRYRGKRELFGTMFGQNVQTKWDLKTLYDSASYDSKFGPLIQINLNLGDPVPEVMSVSPALAASRVAGSAGGYLTIVGSIFGLIFVL